MTNRLEDERWRMGARMDHKQHNQEQELPGTTGQEAAPETHTQTLPDEIQDIYVLVFREREEEEDEAQVVESTLVLPQNISLLPAYAICSCYVLLILSTLAFQLSCLFNPPIATVSIIPKTQTVTLPGTLQLGRHLQPITLSQSQTVPTTGRGHQDARAATGTVTFYNGQQTEQTVAQGTVFTGNDGVSIETTQRATIPPGNPSTGYGTVTVTAQALQAGRKGNIQAGGVNAPIAVAVFVKNNQFTGGQDERDFQTVSKSDINSIATLLKTAVAQSMQGALQGQVEPNEQLYILPNRPTVTSDHQIGQEATQVNVTVSQTCSAVAYDSQELATKVTAFLSTQAQQHIGTGYSLFGTVHVSVQAATVTRRSTVLLSFSASGTWVYGLSQPAQQRIKHLIAGKTTQEALQLLAALPGVEQAAIRFEGFGNDTRLPKQSSLIHLAFVVI